MNSSYSNYNNNKRTFVASSELFSGFRVSIDIRNENIPVDNTPIVSFNPLPTQELKTGQILGTLSYAGTGTPTFELLKSDGSIDNHRFFEIVNGNKLKLKDEYFIDNNNKVN